jgi:hypothetical protein
MMHYTPDAADLFIAAATGQPLSRVCRQQIDIQKRVGGSSFPLHFVAEGDETVVPADYSALSIFDGDPLEILLSFETAWQAIGAADAADFLARLDEIEKIEFRNSGIDALALGISTRRAQQMRAAAITANHPNDKWHELIIKRARKEKRKADLKKQIRQEKTINKLRDIGQIEFVFATKGKK